MLSSIEYKPAIIIAEIGCSHAGRLERAKHLIDLAAESGAKYVKFQKRNPVECVPRHLWDKPHPNEKFAYGKTYLEHRLNLELDIKQHIELKEYCDKVSIGYSSSVWDITSAKEIININPDFIKIPSACNTNIQLLDFIKQNYHKDIHVSLGMLTPSEIVNVLNYFYDIKNRVILYHCTSIYPCPFEKLYLKEIYQLKKIWDRVGFSNHGYGIAADIAAYTLGARYIERHFIDDRAFKHNDAAASLEPAGLKKLRRDLKAIEASLLDRPLKLSTEEETEKNKLKNS